MRALGVEPKDIATDWYVIEPIYEDYDSLYIKGYRINNMVAITLRDVSKTSQVIAAALDAGANQVVNVDLYTSELRKYRDQARDLAMKAAAEKAQALASAAGHRDRLCADHQRKQLVILQRLVVRAQPEPVDAERGSKCRPGRGVVIQRGCRDDQPGANFRAQRGGRHLQPAVKAIFVTRSSARISSS